MKTDVKAAIHAASDARRRYYPNDAYQVRLEEVVWDEASQHWRITLSFFQFPRREYKEFEIAGPQDVVAMHIRQLT